MSTSAHRVNDDFGGNYWEKEWDVREQLSFKVTAGMDDELLGAIEKKFEKEGGRFYFYNGMYGLDIPAIWLKQILSDPDVFVRPEVRE